MAPILALEKISKRFGAVVVADGIDLALNDGEALGIRAAHGVTNHDCGQNAETLHEPRNVITHELEGVIMSPFAVTMSAGV